MSAINSNFARGLVTVALFLGAAACTAPTARASSPVMRIAFPSGMNGQIVVTMEKAGLRRTERLQG